MIRNHKFRFADWAKLLALNVLSCLLLFLAVLGIDHLSGAIAPPRTIFMLEAFAVADVVFVQFFNALFFLPFQVNKNLPSAIATLFLLVMFRNDLQLSAITILPCLINYVFIIGWYAIAAKRQARRAQYFG